MYTLCNVQAEYFTIHWLLGLFTQAGLIVYKQTQLWQN